MTIMKAQLPMVMVIWLALRVCLSNQPIMMPVPTKADDSRNICSEIGPPMRKSSPMRRSEKPRHENHPKYCR